MDSAENNEMAPIARIRETDVDNGHGSNDRGPDTGIDDGFMTGNDEPTNGRGNGTGHRRFPHPPAPSPGGGYVPGKKPVDVNAYATKKTVAQGMMDLALLTANANQLRYVLEAGEVGTRGTYYYTNLVLIILSLLLQVFIGITLIFIGRYNVKDEEHAHKADRLNNYVVLGVFLITIINVFISSFAIEPYEGVDPVLIQKMKASVDASNAERL